MDDDTTTVSACGSRSTRGDICSQAPGHDGLHVAREGSIPWDNATAVDPAALCGLCGRAWGEHVGTRCPKAERAKRTPPPKRHLASPPTVDGPAEPQPAAAPDDPGRYEPTLPIASIEPSPHNRDAKRDLEELARSILEHGVIQPITVRPHPSHDGSYELVAGERRWRASQLAGRATIPAIVRDLTDVGVLEVRLIENVQRVDVHPLEEADGYQTLIAKHGYTVERIVEKTGKSKAWVYGRLKLCSLAKAPREAFLAGKLQPSIALLIARIPTQALQEQATKGVLGGGSHGEYYAADVDPGRTGNAAEPLNVKQAAAFIHRHFMLRLELAKFDITDRTLTSAGACTDCTYRTGNQRELFADVQGPDVCTNPPCHAEKTQADFDRAAAEAKAQGVDVLDGKKAEGLFVERGDGTQALSYGASQKYIDPADEADHIAWPDPEKKAPTWGKLLGKDLAKVPRVLVQDAAGGRREVYDKAGAMKVLTEAGKVPKPRKTVNPYDNYKDENRKRNAALQKRRDVVKASLRTLVKAQGEHFIDGVGPKAVTWWRWVALAIARGLSPDDQATVASTFFDLGKRTEAHKVLEKEIDASGVMSCRGLIVAMLASTNASGGAYSSSYGATFVDACKTFGVDTKGVQRKLDEEAKVRPAKPAKKAAKGGRK